MKVQEIKKYFVLFYMFGFLAGILSANFIAGEYLADLGIFHEFFMEQYMQTPIDNSEYFWYLLRLRITPVSYTHLDVYKRQPLSADTDCRYPHAALSGMESIYKRTEADNKKYIFRVT